MAKNSALSGLKVLVKLDRDDVEAAWRRARLPAEASAVSA
jgi:hypothetical protein